jgi:hypothetical protein
VVPGAGGGALRDVVAGVDELAVVGGVGEIEPGPAVFCVGGAAIATPTTNTTNDTAMATAAMPRLPIRAQRSRPRIRATSAMTNPTAPMKPINPNNPDTAVGLPSRRCAVLAREFRRLVDLRYSYAAGR